MAEKNCYAGIGHFTGENLFGIIIKDLLFDGTFYHLWYLPASMIGILIICLLCCKYSLKTVLIISGILYIIGLFGDSYYGIVSQISWVQSIYGFLFTFSSYTRNGIFFAPIFLFMGYIIEKSGCCQKKFASITHSFHVYIHHSLILVYTHPAQFYLLEKYQLSQTVVDYEYAKMLNQYGKIIKVHIKIDTGMHRLGERPENVSRIIKMFECDNLSIQGIFSHLCVADSLDKSDVDFTYHQIKCFYETIAQLESLGYSCPKKHIQSSYGLLNYPELKCDYARVGRMCMDQTIIDVSNITSIKQNDIAVILGKSGNAEITAYDIARSADTITNEILSRLGKRLDKVYCYK